MPQNAELKADDEPEQALAPAPQQDQEPEMEPVALARKAMTWKSTYHNSTSGVDGVSCAQCDAYLGDTTCTASLPVLCIKQDGSDTPSGLVTGFYNGWAAGHIATTHAMQGTTLTSLQVADQFCVDNFGPGWRMAEFHDGNGGWNWFAYGNVRKDTRFWVHIDDQPSNCWDL